MPTPPPDPTSPHGSTPRARTSSTRARSPQAATGRTPTAREAPDEAPCKAPEKVVAVCGPTAAGKSPLADGLADELSRAWGERVPVLVVDSMQVYRGLEVISNQARDRPAELVSVVPLTERWTVARHAAAAEEILSRTDHGAVLDAGTGMYLNAILLDLPIAPKVPPDVREVAERAAAGEANPRRAARELELRMSGAPKRGSIWDGDPVRDTTLLYVRPDRTVLDAAIARRSRRIAENGLGEVEAIRELQREGVEINPSVLDAVGVKEMLLVADGDLGREEAAERVATRTRRLARRQMRWFDKLARTLEGRARVRVLPTTDRRAASHCMHDILGL